MVPCIQSDMDECPLSYVLGVGGKYNLVNIYRIAVVTAQLNLNSKGSQGVPRDPKEFPGVPRGPNGSQGVPMGPNGSQGGPKGFQGVPRFPRGPNGPQGVPGAPKEFQGVPKGSKGSKGFKRVQKAPERDNNPMVPKFWVCSIEHCNKEDIEQNKDDQ